MNLTKSMQASRKKGAKKYAEKRRTKLLKQLQAGTLPKRLKNSPAIARTTAKRQNIPSKKDNAPYRKRKPISKLSKKRAAQNREYLKLRTQFLKEHPKCQVYPIFNSVEIHHKKGRIGKLLTDTRYWLAVSRTAHDWIGANPKKAYELGYSLKRLAK